MIVGAVLTGQVVPFGRDGQTSAIAKSLVDGRRDVGLLGLAGDEQADRRVHGGPDKALHHYPRDHYDWWRATLGDLPLLDCAGAFGENISTAGLTEDAACLGDRFQLGTALVEIAQGRQPCWKQAHRLNAPQVVAQMVESGRSGWYYRVIEEGSVAAGDALVLLERPHPEWSIARVTGFIVGGRGRQESAAMRDLSTLSVLADGWRARAAKLGAP